MESTPERKAARHGIRKTLAVLVAIAAALYIGSFFFLTD